MKCILCGKKIEVVGTWRCGNNAQPLSDGRCCNSCNSTKVIPARLSTITSNSSDTIDLNRDNPLIKDNDNSNKTIYKGFIQTEKMSLFECSNCKEEYTNESAFSRDELIICRKCFEEEDLE